MLVLDRDGTMMEAEQAELPHPVAAQTSAAPADLHDLHLKLNALDRSLEQFGPALAREIHAEVRSSINLSRLARLAPPPEQWMSAAA